MFILIIFEHY